MKKKGSEREAAFLFRSTTPGRKRKFPKKIQQTLECNQPHKLVCKLICDPRRENGVAEDLIKKA